jgi:hypothetical protein
MSITLELPPDVEAKLREGAANHDVEAVQRVYVEEAARLADATMHALEQNVASEQVRRADGLTDDEFEEIMAELDAMEPLPSFPDSTWTRAEIYGDHP